MPRNKRSIQAGYAYHVTIRCNNREFKLQHRECREVFLYAIKKAIEKYKFKLRKSVRASTSSATTAVMTN